MHLDRMTLLLLVACSSGADPSPDPTSTTTSAPTPTGTTATTAPTELEPRVTSRDPVVKRKTGDQLVTDLAEALVLPAEALCTELGSTSCAEAHRVALGGVDAYKGAQYQPLTVPPVTATIAVERLALSACHQRVQTDLAGDPVILGPVLATDDRAARAQVAGAWIDRLLRRRGLPDEIDALADLWDEAAAESDYAVHDGAVLTCFVVATSFEHLFY